MKGSLWSILFLGIILQSVRCAELQSQGRQQFPDAVPGAEIAGEAFGIAERAGMNMVGGRREDIGDNSDDRGRRSPPDHAEGGRMARARRSPCRRRQQPPTQPPTDGDAEVVPATNRRKRDLTNSGQMLALQQTKRRLETNFSQKLKYLAKEGSIVNENR